MILPQHTGAILERSQNGRIMNFHQDHTAGQKHLLADEGGGRGMVAPSPTVVAKERDVPTKVKQLHIFF